MTNTPQYEKGRLYQISVIDFRTDPDQPRKYFDPAALQELAESIKRHGIIQPVLFQPAEQGWLNIVAGERRIAAAKLAGLLMIPALMVEGNTDEISLVENLQRKDLTPVEEAEALDRIMKRHSYSQEDLIAVVGKPKSSISELLSLNRLPAEIKAECRKDPSVPRYILVEIAKSKQERGMLTMYRKYKEKKLSKEQLKEQSWTKRKTSSEMLISSFGSLKTRLEKTATAPDLDDVQRQELAAQAEGLKESLNAFIATLQNPTPDSLQDGESSPVEEGTTGGKPVLS